MYVEFHPNQNLISSAAKSEQSGKHASHSSGNGYKAFSYKAIYQFNQYKFKNAFKCDMVATRFTYS